MSKVLIAGRWRELGFAAATVFAGEFLGRSVSLDGILRKTTGGYWVELAGGARIALEAEANDRLSDGAAVRLSARPEDIALLPPAELGINQIAAVIEQVDYLGDRFECSMRAADELVVLSVAKKERYQVGTKVRLSFDPKFVSVHLR